MSKYFFLLKEIWKGKSVLRAYFNYSLLSVELKGRTIDIGGGHGEEYVSFVKRSDDVKFETFDLKSGQVTDFEKDSLPAQDGSYDTVLFLNVMEHIFNYQHIANEVMRITKSGGQLIGYVPFLMWYHPDHKDYFRYTHEALEIIYKKANAKDVEIIPDYCGPFIAASHMMIRSTPRIVRPIIFTINYFLDEIFFFLKKTRKTRFVLGYLFVCKK